MNAQSKWQSFTANLVDAAKADALPLALASFYIAIALFALATIGVYGIPIAGPVKLMGTFLMATGLFIGIMFLKELFSERPDSPFKFAREFIDRKSYIVKTARQIPVVLLICFFLPVFSAFKGSISAFSDYTWDRYWIEADRAIHGQDVWLVLQPLLGYPIITFVLGILYVVWLPLIIASVIYFSLLLEKPKLRTQFLLSYFSCWAILGSVFAILFASVGPCFSKPLLGITDFDPQMRYLASVNAQYPMVILQIQERLIGELAEGSLELGAGITAMPSMHVSMTFLYWLAVRHLNRWLGWAAFLYLIIIQVASVHLAFHYAVDGYFSMAGTWVIWKLCGYVTSRATHTQNELRPQELPQFNNI